MGIDEGVLIMLDVNINILDNLNMPELGMRLQQARKQRGFTQAQAADLIHVARTTIVAMEKGERRIKPEELIRLARAYGRHISDFVRSRPQIEPFAVQFRSSFQRTSEDNAQITGTIEHFEELCRDYLELEQIVESPLTYKYPPEYNVGVLPLARAAETIAQEERNRLGLGDGPIPLLRDLLGQDVGLRIFYVEMKPSHRFSAMYTYNQQLGGCIGVNSLHPEERRRLSLAHEYAHFLVDRYKTELLAIDSYQRKPESERFADLFAIYFLMPTVGLARRYNDIRQTQGKFTAADLCTLAHYYGVSVEALTQRLEELKFLPTGMWDRLRDSGFRVQKAQQELGLPPIPAVDDLLPKRYQYLAVHAFDQGKITEGQLARFLHVDRLTARHIASTVSEETDNVMEDAPLDLTRSATE
jgi:Zn-dependent peptidase ImmA (M78 family)/DNA-binding XRE family transcriptional regulator